MLVEVSSGNVFTILVKFVEIKVDMPDEIKFGR